MRGAHHCCWGVCVAAAKELILELVEAHYEAVYRFAYRLSGNAQDAAELAQETFCRAQERLHQLQDRSKARAWLLAITRNVFVQDQRRRRWVTLDGLAEPLSEPPGGQRDTITSEELQAALNRLPEEFRTPVILYYFGEHSYQEIAQILGVPIGTVMSRLSRAKAKLRALLGLESVHTRREV